MEVLLDGTMWIVAAPGDEGTHFRLRHTSQVRAESEVCDSVGIPDSDCAAKGPNISSVPADCAWISRWLAASPVRKGTIAS
jgi:hypothetical protein